MILNLIKEKIVKMLDKHFYYFFIYSAVSMSVVSSSSCSVLIFISLYFSIPVPAGISFPIITFSFNPSKSSTFPFIAASVNTLVVSWNGYLYMPLRFLFSQQMVSLTHLQKRLV